MMDDHQFLITALSFLIGAVLVVFIWLVHSLNKHRKAEAVRLIQLAASELIEQYRKDNEMVRCKNDALKKELRECQGKAA